ncbi:MAG: hypothetical protein ACI30M_04115 [Muribaculaceae bacterium]
MIIEFKLDPCNEQEVDIAIKMLYSLNPHVPVVSGMVCEGKSQDQNNDGEPEEASDSINEELAKLKKENSELSSKCEELNNNVEKYKSQEDEALKVFADEEKRLNEELEQKEKEINGLREKLRKYEPEGFEDGKQLLFRVVDDGSSQKLQRTEGAMAQYVAMIGRNNEVIYKFNPEGPCVDACRNRKKQLEPFCVIVGEEDDANSIEFVEWGRATLVGYMDHLKIEKKAEIKLVKR